MSVVRSSAAMKQLIFVTGFGLFFAYAAAAVTQSRQTGTRSGTFSPSSVVQRIETPRGTCQCVPYHDCDAANTVDTTIIEIRGKKRSRRQTIARPEQCTGIDVCCLAPKSAIQNNTNVNTIIPEKLTELSTSIPIETPVTDSTSVPCICRPYFQCGQNETEIIEGGATLINERMGMSLDCRGEEVVCCHKSFKPPDGDEPIEPPVTSEPTLNIPRTCGTRNKKISLSMNRIQASGNEQTLFGEYPWQLAVFTVDNAGNYDFLCGASLIQPSVAITAAHCLRRSQASDLKVRAGEWDARGNNQEEVLEFQEQFVADIIRHPYFHNATLYNDVAILRLAAPFTLDEHIGLICLPSKDSPDPTNCIATGWGKSAFKKDSQLQAVMRQVSLPYVLPSECENKLKKTRVGQYFVLDKSFNCAGGVSDEDTCVGDGGGPLSCLVAGSEQFYLIGITSWGIECGIKDVPGVYTNVRYFFDWISSNLQ